MPESSQKPMPRIRGTCTDCGAPIEVEFRRGQNAVCCEACQAKRRNLAGSFISPAMEMPAGTPWFLSWKFWLRVLLLGSLAGAGFFWRQELLGKYHRWTQNMHARRAVEAFERKDYAHAIIDGRRALDFDPRDIETNRIIAKSREAEGSTEAIGWRARLNFLRPGDAENAIAWARDAMKAGAIEIAEEALAAVKPAGRNTADYHEIAARVAMARTDSVKAESHWKEAVRLAPASEDYRLQLATLDVTSRLDAIRESATKTLTSLAEIPRHRLIALRALIEDAMNRQEFSRARAFADQLVASPDAGFMESLGRLGVLRAQNAPDAPRYLDQLREQSLEDPEQLFTLLRWMNNHDLPLLVSDWVAILPPEIVSKPPVCLAIADAYGRDRDWPKLRAFVDKAVWKDFEHVRLGQLSHALENFGNVVAAEASWNRAIAECRDKPERLIALIRLAQSWHSEQREEITLRKLSIDERAPVWVLDSLWVIARKAGNSEELHRLSRLIVKARPKSPEARNNFIRLSLLRREDEGATNQLADAFFNEQPADLRRAVTYSLSLFLQGKILEAKETLASFPEAERRDPEAALYYGMYLQASGDSPHAQEYLQIARETTLLRDEVELLARVKRDSRFNTLTPAPKSPPAPAKKPQ